MRPATPTELRAANARVGLRRREYLAIEETLYKATIRRNDALKELVEAQNLVNRTDPQLAIAARKMTDAKKRCDQLRRHGWGK